MFKKYTEDIAHQLKTPLTGVLLMLDLMEGDEENKKEYIDRIRKSTNRLHQLVDILLKLAVLDSGTVKMKKEIVNVKDLLSEVIAEMEILFVNRKYNIPVSGEDFKLICDRKWTYEAIYNIVKNGMEASKDRGIKVNLKKTNIYQSIIIEDFSNGISDEVLKKVYKRFYKENKDSKCNNILNKAKYSVSKLELHYICIKESETEYTVRPAWVATMSEIGETAHSFQMIIDAQTAEEIIL